METLAPNVTTSFCKMYLKSENLVFIHLFEYASIEIPEVDEIHKNINVLVDNKPCYLVVFPAHGSTSSNEARKYAAKLKEKNVIAEALIIDSLAIRLLAAFFIKVNKPKQKMRIFANLDPALAWINSIVAKAI